MKIIALLLAFVLLFTVSGCAARVNEEPSDTSKQTDTVDTTADDVTAEDTFEAMPEYDDAIEISDNIFSDKKEFSSGVSAEIYVTSPYVIAPHYAENVELLNQIIETNVDSFKNDYLQDVAMNENAEGATSSSRMLVYNPYFADNGKVSLLLSCNIYIGGSAHPSIVHRGVNFDLESGTVIELKDLIGCDVDTLKSKILEKMRQDPDYYYSTEDGVLDAYDISHSFLFDGENVYIYFDEYQIGPRSSGFTIFEFTYDELS